MRLRLVHARTPVEYISLLCKKTRRAHHSEFTKEAITTTVVHARTPVEYISSCKKTLRAHHSEFTKEEITTSARPHSKGVRLLMQKDAVCTPLCVSSLCRKGYVRTNRS